MPVRSSSDTTSSYSLLSCKICTITVHMYHHPPYAPSPSICTITLHMHHHPPYAPSPSICTITLHMHHHPPYAPSSSICTITLHMHHHPPYAPSPFICTITLHMHHHPPYAPSPSVCTITLRMHMSTCGTMALTYMYINPLAYGIRMHVVTKHQTPHVVVVDLATGGEVFENSSKVLLEVILHHVL